MRFRCILGVLVAICAATAWGCGGEESPASDSAAAATAPVAGTEAFAQRDWPKAYTELMPAAEQGNADAQFRIGFMYLYGLGVPADHDEADTWIRRAAEQGHAEAQYTMALNYRRGMGVPRDIVQALMWATLAADQGYVAANDVRDDSIAQMTEDQITEARRLASEWSAEH
jgi:TPR repeat protein